MAFRAVPCAGFVMLGDEGRLFQGAMRCGPCAALEAGAGVSSRIILGGVRAAVEFGDVGERFHVVVFVVVLALERAGTEAEKGGGDEREKEFKEEAEHGDYLMASFRSRWRMLMA